MPIGTDKQNLNCWMYSDENLTTINDVVANGPKEITVNPERINYKVVDKHEELFNDMMSYYKSVATKNISTNNITNVRERESNEETGTGRADGTTPESTS
jgi:hypothetical protein